MELEFNNDRIQFRKEGTNNLIVDTAIGKYNEIEVDIFINKSTQIVDNDMIVNILNYVHKEITELERMFKPLLENLWIKFNEHLQQPNKLGDIGFEFVGIWIESDHVFNSQFHLVYRVNGNDRYPNLDVTGKWTINFSGSINNWIISGVNRIG